MLPSWQFRICICQSTKSAHTVSCNSWVLYVLQWVGCDVTKENNPQGINVCTCTTYQHSLCSTAGSMLLSTCRKHHRHDITQSKHSMDRTVNRCHTGLLCLKCLPCTNSWPNIHIEISWSINPVSAPTDGKIPRGADIPAFGAMPQGMPPPTDTFEAFWRVVIPKSKLLPCRPKTHDEFYWSVIELKSHVPK